MAVHAVNAVTCAYLQLSASHANSALSCRPQHRLAGQPLTITMSEAVHTLKAEAKRLQQRLLDSLDKVRC